MFLYFIPHGDHLDLSPAALQALGLHTRLATRGPHEMLLDKHRVLGRGPGGESGTILCDPAQRERIYAPDKQTWRKAVGQPWWVGMWNATPILPQQLLRADALPGHEVRLEDGHEWLIPRAVGVVEDSGGLTRARTLPAVSGLDEAGKWTPKRIAARYAALDETARRVADSIYGPIVSQTAAGDEAAGGAVGQDTIEVQTQTLFEDAIAAIATNYRVGAEELDLLGALSERACGEVLAALVDWPGFRQLLQARLEKKTAASERAGQTESAPPPAG